MRKILWLIFFVLLVFSGFLFYQSKGFINKYAFSPKKGEKSEFVKIGQINWFTEYSIDKAFERAKKEKKLVFVDFSTTWCHPCQMLKANVYSSGKFADILKYAVPVYIEGTTKKGRELLKKYKVRAFPTIKILNSEGKELTTIVGARMDIDFYLNTVKMVTKNITKDNIIDLIKKGKVSLKDAIAFADSFDHRKTDKRIEILKTALDNYKGNDESVYFQGVEKLLQNVFSKLLDIKSKEGVKRDVFEKEWKGIFDNYISKLSEYDKNIIQFEIIGFFYNFDYPGVDKTVDLLLKEGNIKTLLLRARNLYGFLLAYLIKKDDIKRANNLIEDSLNVVMDKNLPLKDKENMLQNIAFSLYYNASALDLSKENEKKEAEILADYEYKLYSQFKGSKVDKNLNLFNYVSYFNRFLGLLTEQVIKEYKESLSKADGQKKAELYEKIAFAYLYGGRIKEAEDVIKTNLDTDSVKKLLGDKGFANMLNNICWEFVTKKHSDDYIISLSEKAVKLVPNDAFIDTLANLYALKGDYNKAVELEKKALNIGEKNHSRPDFIQSYKRSIEEWSKKEK